MDCGLATASAGSPELGLHGAGVAQIAQSRMLPGFVAGLQADSQSGDFQADNDTTMTALMAASAGADLIDGGPG